MAFQTVLRRESNDKDLEEFAVALGEPRSSTSSSSWVWMRNFGTGYSSDEDSDQSSDHSEDQWYQAVSAMSAESYFPPLYDTQEVSSRCGHTASNTECNYRVPSFLSSSDDEICLNIWTRGEDDTKGECYPITFSSQSGCLECSAKDPFFHRSATSSREKCNPSSEESFHTCPSCSDIGLLQSDEGKHRVSVWDSDTDVDFYPCASAEVVSLNADSQSDAAATNSDGKYIDASVQTSSLAFGNSTSHEEYPHEDSLGKSKTPPINKIAHSSVVPEIDSNEKNESKDGCKYIELSNTENVFMLPGTIVGGLKRGDIVNHSSVQVSILEDMVSCRGVEVVREVCTYYTTSQRLDWHNVLPPDKQASEKHLGKRKANQFISSIHQMVHPHQGNSQELFKRHAPSFLSLLPCGQAMEAEKEEEEGEEETDQSHWTKLPPPQSGLDLCDGRKLPLLERFVKQADDVLVLEILVGCGLIGALFWKYYK